MVSDASQEWFLEIGEKKTGPFTTEQVLGLLADKEISEQQRVTSGLPDSVWISVGEFARIRTPKPFTPPPRPSDLVLSTDSSHSSSSANFIPSAQDDPAISLFDALQAAKERKPQSGARALPPESVHLTPHPFSLDRIPKRAWVVVGIGLLFFGAALLMTRYIKGRISSQPDAAQRAVVSPSQTLNASAGPGGSPMVKQDNSSLINKIHSAPPPPPPPSTLGEYEAPPEPPPPLEAEPAHPPQPPIPGEPALAPMDGGGPPEPLPPPPGPLE
ncbi:hypothetical protein WDW37_03085 [Bdellovibrionota bacterium FG-1]